MTIRKMMKKNGNLLYVYDERVLRSRCAMMRDFSVNLEESLPGVEVSMHYSTKANSNPHILNIVRDEGLSVDCMSPWEMNFVELAKFTKDKILYVCNNVEASEMKRIQHKGILACLDSISQVETWGKVCEKTSIGKEIMVRINPGTAGVGHSKKVETSGKDTKFGISEANFKELFATAEKYGLKIIGTHQHLGSLFLNDKIPDYIYGVVAGLKLVKKYFHDVQIVDLGGGFGVPYKPDEIPLNLELVAEELKPLLQEFTYECPSVKELKFEPGRFIPCEAGKLYGVVTAIKHENGVYWIGTNIGMNELVRPSMYDSYHEISLPETVKGPKVIANFCGNVCKSGDVLGRNRKVILPKVGDLVVVDDAGAYGYAMASNYTLRALPAEIMLHKDGSMELIRRRQKFEDITNLFIM